MSIRIVTSQTKVTSVIVAYVLGIAVSVSVAVAAGFVTGVTVGLALLVASLLFFTRTFRGGSEEIAPPRAWWRMTERPRAGYVMAIIFALHLIYLLVEAFAGQNLVVSLAAAVISVAVVAAFLNSSIRLSLRQPKQRPAEAHTNPI